MTQAVELLAASRAVACAPLNEFQRQSRRLALLVQQGAVEKPAAVDRLQQIAHAYGIVSALGEDRVRAILSEAFTGCEFHPMVTEKIA
jgi:hypothetical protein